MNGGTGADLSPRSFMPGNGGCEWFIYYRLPPSNTLSVSRPVSIPRIHGVVFGLRRNKDKRVPK